jgi:cytochrome c556
MMLRTAILTLWFCLCGGGLVTAQQEAPKTPRQDDAKQSQPETKSPAAADKPQEKVSDAERVMRLQRAIEENEKRLKELNDKLNDPESEYAKAEAELKALDKELEPKKKELQKLKDEGKTDQAATLQSEVDALEQRRKLAKDRYELAFQERNTLLEQKTPLEQKITQDREASHDDHTRPAGRSDRRPAGSGATRCSAGRPTAGHAPCRTAARCGSARPGTRRGSGRGGTSSTGSTDPAGRRRRQAPQPRG